MSTERVCIPATAGQRPPAVLGTRLVIALLSGLSFLLGCRDDDCFHLKLNVPYEVTLEGYVGPTQGDDPCGEDYDLRTGDTFWLWVRSETDYGGEVSCPSPDLVELGHFPASVGFCAGPFRGGGGGNPRAPYRVLGTEYEWGNEESWEFYLDSVDPPETARLLADYRDDAPHLYATRRLRDCGDVWEAQLKLVDEDEPAQ